MSARAEAVRIVAGSVAAAIGYGVLHDQVTAHVCLEYFTIGHPRLFASDVPALHAAAWGAIATWWVGLLLGTLLAFAATRGPRPVRTARSLARPTVLLLLIAGGSALAAGGLGYLLANAGVVVLLEPLASAVPRERHVAFLAVLWAHLASYGVAALGALVLARHVWRSRRHEPFASAPELAAFVAETCRLLETGGVGAAAAPLARVQATAWTTGTEWLGELGNAAREAEAAGRLPADLAGRLARIRAFARRG